MLKLFSYPVDIIYDYMHLICLNHVPSLIKRFVTILSKNSIAQIDSSLSSIRLPHDVHITFDYSISSVHDWKAKHSRLFILNLGLPILVKHLPKSISSHFSIYAAFVKIVHCPSDLAEVQLANQLINHYCKTSAAIYDPKIELYSLHAHLHLPEQVLSKF